MANVLHTVISLECMAVIHRNRHSTVAHILHSDFSAVAEQSQGTFSLFNLIAEMVTVMGCEATPTDSKFGKNHPYQAPVVSQSTRFSFHPEALLRQWQLARETHPEVKPVILGPLTFLALAHTQDDSDPLLLLDQLIPFYSELLELFAEDGAQWVQIDEPILVTELPLAWKTAFEQSYHTLKANRPNILLATYLGALKDNLQLACNLPVAGLHVDVTSDRSELNRVIDWLPIHKVLSLAPVRSAESSGADAVAERSGWLRPLADKLGERLWLASACR